MKFLWTWVIFSLSCAAWSQSFYSSMKTPPYRNKGWRAGSTLSQAYHYNPFYTDLTQSADMSTIIQPILGCKVGSEAFSVNATAEGSYERFMKYQKLSHFDYKGNLEIPINFESGLEIKLRGEFKEFSDRSESENVDRYGRNRMSGGMDILIPMGTGRKLLMEGDASIDTFEDTNQSRYTHFTGEGKMTYSQSFLPETYWYLRGTAGLNYYPTPKAPTAVETAIVKGNSIYTMGEGGIAGRMTERASLDAGFGYQYRIYDDKRPGGNDDYGGVAFTEPLFYIKFMEQVTRRDQLLGGFDYTIHESYFSEYYTDQEIFLGFGRLVGDQALLLARLSYTYRTFSLPNRRDDQRIAANFAGRFSLSPTVKLIGDLQVDMLNTDAYSDNAPNPGEDRPGSYKAGRISAGIMAEF